MGDLFQPFLRQAGVGTVLELHIALAARPGLPDLFQRQGLALVIHGDVQREPLFLFVAHHLRGDGALGRAHLVAGQGLFAVDAVIVHQLGVGIQQEGDGLFRFEEPQAVGAGLEVHGRQLAHELGLLVLMPPHQIGLPLVGVTAGLEIGIGPVERELAVLGLVDVVDLQREQAAFLVQEEFGIVGGGLEHRLHLAQELLRLVKLRGGQARPYPVEEFGYLLMRHQSPVCTG